MQFPFFSLGSAGVLISSIILSACASLTLGTEQRISVKTTSQKSAVENARCILSNDKGQWETLTPGSVEIPKSTESLNIVCTKEDFQPVQASVPSSVQRGKVMNFALGGVAGVVLDSYYDARFSYPEKLTIELGLPQSLALQSAAKPALPETIQTAEVAILASIEEGIKAQAQGDDFKAEQAYMQALEQAVALKSLPLMATVQSNLMNLYASSTLLNSSELAIWYGKRAIDHVNRLGRHDFSPYESRPQLVAGNFTAVYEALAHLLLKSSRFSEAEAVGRMLKLYELRQWSGIDLAGREPSRLELSDQEIDYDKERELLTYARWMSRFAQSVSEKIPPVETEWSSQTRVGSVVGSQDNEALVLQYFLTDTQLAVLVSKGGHSTVRFAPISRKEMERQITALRLAIFNRLNFSPYSRDLWDLMIGPVQDLILESKPGTLVLNLPGRLRYLPFAALQNPEGRFLIEDHALVNWSHAVQDSAHLALRAQYVEGLGLSQARMGQVALPGVRDELLAIVRTEESPKGLIPGRLALDEQFDEARLFDVLAGDSSIVHLATHFVSKPGRAEQSLLFLGKGDPVSILRLSQSRPIQSELVTLSACETAIGSDTSAHGVEVEGLAAVFLHRNASSVMASLWKVSDDSTRRLMKSFYGYKVTGKVHQAEALRLAQLELLYGKDQSMNHPFYWAAFSLTGAWLPVER